MSVLYVVLPLALLMAAAAVAAFAWSVSRGQYDDLDTPQVRMLFDDPVERKVGEPAPAKRDATEC